MSLPVSQHQAWKFLTDKKHIENWWGSHVSLEAKSGGTFLEKWSDGERTITTSGRIKTFNAPAELKMIWADEDWPGDTVVIFSLSSTGNETRLKFEHSGWEIHPNVKRPGLMKDHAAGWSMYLERLGQYATEKTERQENSSGYS